jgi:hypothetical protein
MTASDAPDAVGAAQKPTFRTSKWPTLLDYSLRWMLAGLYYRLNLLGSLAFWLLNFLLAVLMFSFLFMYRDEKLMKKYRLTTAIVPVDDALSIVLWLTASFSGAWVAGQLYDSLLLGLVVLLLYGFYMLLLMFTPMSRSQEDIKREKQTPVFIPEEETGDSIDLNDQRIVRMEAEISSISRRVEAYTIESTFFGALSFSGFVTLVASGRVQDSDFTAITGATSGLASILLGGRLRDFLPAAG